MRGNCFESQQIWWSEIRADDGGGGVIRIRVGGGRGLERVEGGGEGFGRGGSICTHSVTMCVLGCAFISVYRLRIFPDYE